MEEVRNSFRARSISLIEIRMKINWDYTRKEAEI
jgi:hypothetical protein